MTNQLGNDLIWHQLPNQMLSSQSPNTLSCPCCDAWSHVFVLSVIHVASKWYWWDAKGSGGFQGWTYPLMSSDSRVHPPKPPDSFASCQNHFFMNWRSLKQNALPYESYIRQETVPRVSGDSNYVLR